jgi:hypothetical protein
MYNAELRANPMKIRKQAYDLNVQDLEEHPCGHSLCGTEFLSPAPKNFKQIYARMGRSADKVFPIHFGSQAAIAGGPVTGFLEGFLYLDSQSDQEYEVH